jgi:hypothetical protein
VLCVGMRYIYADVLALKFTASNPGDVESSQECLRMKSAGERFGDAELITSTLKRAATAIACDDVELLVLPRTIYYR